MKKTSTHLYDLIYSLSSSERRYFKLYIAKRIGKDNKLCLQLFDLIIKSEGKPIEKVEKKINFTKHPSRLKNYLYDTILKSLEAYHSTRSPTIKIRKAINQIENLYNKALFDQCVILAKKTLKDAEMVDNQNFKIDVLTWYILSLSQLEDKNALKMEKELSIQQEDAINNLKLEREFQKLNKSLFNFTKKVGTLRSKENDDKLKELIDSPLLSDYSLATSYHSKYTFNTIYASYYGYLADNKNENFYQKRNLTLYEDYPAMKDAEQLNYLTCLNNYALNCAGSGEYEKAEYYYSKMEEIDPNTEQIEIKRFEYFSSNRLDLYLRMPNLKKGLSLVENIEEGLKKNDRKINRLFKSVIYSNLCYLFFASGQYKKALQYNNLIISQENTVYRSDIFRFARIMNLLIHYENEDKTSIEYFYESLTRYLKKQNENYLFEGWFMSFFKALLKVSQKDEKAFLKAEERKLLAILEDFNERKVISHFNILAWFRVKIDQVSFEEAMRLYSTREYQEYKRYRS